MIKPERILFLAEGQLGDSLLLTPALKAVKDKFPGSHVAVLLFYRRRYTETGDTEGAYIRNSSFKGTAEVFQHNPYVDEVIELDKSIIKRLKGFTRIKAELRNIRELRKRKFDTVISTFPQDRFSYYGYFSGASVRIGERKQRPHMLLNRRLDIDQNKLGVLDYFLGMLAPLGITDAERNTYFSIRPEDSAKAQEYKQKSGIGRDKMIVGVHPGSSMNDRKWLPDRFAQVMNSLAAEDNADILLMYSEYDIPFINEIKKNIKAKIREIQTRTLSELASYEKLCAFCITHSSGPRHLAAAIGVPTVGIFDKLDNIRWGIYDTKIHPVLKTTVPCETCPEDKCLGVIPNGETYSSNCMREVSVEAVLKAAREMVNRLNK